VNGFKVDETNPEGFSKIAFAFASMSSKFSISATSKEVAFVSCDAALANISKKSISFGKSLIFAIKIYEAGGKSNQESGIMEKPCMSM